MTLQNNVSFRTKLEEALCVKIMEGEGIKTHPNEVPLFRLPQDATSSGYFISSSFCCTF